MDRSLYRGKKRLSGRGRPRFSRKSCLRTRAERAAPLQFRHDALDEIVEALWKIGKHHIESVAAATVEPILHLVGDHGGCSHEGVTGIATEPLRQLSTVRFSRLARSMTRSRPLLLALVSGMSGNGPSGSNLEASCPRAIERMQSHWHSGRGRRAAPASLALRRGCGQPPPVRQAGSSDGRDPVHFLHPALYVRIEPLGIR